MEEEFKRFEKNKPDRQNFDGGQINRNYLRLKDMIEAGDVEACKDEIRQLAEQTKMLCEAQVKQWYRRKLFVGFGRTRFLRVVTFDIAMPLIAFGFAVGGWLGLLDWVAPWLEATFPRSH
ncbi:hypothetical protein DEA8626_00012 [Defluviimonas aquaemixtae]|uniref:Uncharacterized protein n=1 Tax=Albidovulum aquaemixtae TaxID=1542388 RepID=A0A2R8B1Q1_9RHOB|nr:hypothetical protein [Defluviimonas aquaemixtae]SPH16503.1 hypothetical protein DEA8626_00012 [Defluviimonas aquaemixtae]